MYGYPPVFTGPVIDYAEIAEAESKSIASLVMGILGVALCTFLAGVIIGPLAVSRANKSRSVLDESNQKYWIALAGKILGYIGLGLSIFFALYWILIFGIIAAFS